MIAADIISKRTVTSTASATAQKQKIKVNIVVCLKQILDPEIPSRDFRVDSEKMEAQRGGASLVTNIFCENALETALQFREKFGGRITALIFAPAGGEDSLRKALAMKADAAVHVINDGAAHPDPLAVARVLAAAVRRLGNIDLVMVGRESGDWGVGQTGGLMAEELGIPSVSFVDRLEKQERGLLLHRQTDQGWENVEAQTPLVVTITNDDQNLPRIPKTRDIMLSSRQPIIRWSLEDLAADDAGIDVAEIRAGGGYYRVVDLAIPTKEIVCEMVAGETLEERVDQLADRIMSVVRSL